MKLHEVRSRFIRAKISNKDRRQSIVQHRWANIMLERRPLFPFLPPTMWILGKSVVRLPRTHTVGWITAGMSHLVVALPPPVLYNAAGHRWHVAPGTSLSTSIWYSLLTLRVLVCWLPPLNTPCIFVLSRLHPISLWGFIKITCHGWVKRIV